VLAEPHLLEVREAVRQLSELNHGGIEALSVASTKSGWRRSAWVLSVGALGLALAVLLGRRLYRSIARPLEVISRTLVAIGQGDLARRVAYQAHDELGQIAGALNATAERLAAEEASLRGRLQVHERLAQALLDTVVPAGFVADREGRVILAGRQARDRFGENPLETLRKGAGGLVPPGDIDRRLEALFSLRASQLPDPGSAAPDPLSVRPIIGRGGSLLGALVRLEPPAPATPRPSPVR
jgi:PAS domain-containing protein